jgi:hypothetical protein
MTDRPYDAVFLFSGGGLLLDGDALGANYEFAYEGAEVTLRMPTIAEIHRGLVDPEPPAGGPSGKAAFYREKDGHTEYEMVAVERFEVAVRVETSDPRPEVIGEALPIAARVAEAFIGSMRVAADQPWLPPEHKGLDLTGLKWLRDPATGRPVDPSVIWNPTMVLTSFARESAAKRATLDAAVAEVVAGIRPDLARSLLADATAVAMSRAVQADWKADRFDTAQVLLLATMASEVNITSTLTRVAPMPTRALLGVILDRQRGDAASLLHRPMEALCGRSLREESKPHQPFEGLYGRVKTQLFEVRNKVAHAGYKPSTVEARDALRTARDLFAWLDAV